MSLLLTPSLCPIISFSVLLTTIITFTITTTLLIHQYYRSGSLPFNGPGRFDHQTIPHMCLDSTAPGGALPPFANKHQDQLGRCEQCT